MKTPERNLRVGVVGVGQMGAHHLRVYSNMKYADCVGVYDVRREAAEEAARIYGCEVFASFDDMIGKVDAVTVATPSHTHTEVGTRLLSRGIHCLIDRPRPILHITP